MLNTLMSQQTQAWFETPGCPARRIIEHIRTRGYLRDPQIEAIKTYLFLKIAGGNRPLWQLFCDGSLTTGEDLSRLHISQQVRALFEENPAARALFEFSRSKEDGGAKTLLPQLEKYLLDHAAEVDCQSIIKNLFYGVEYPDYLFSLPMGAGKTFLMAAFIYLDLYFAQNEADNKIWAHNFILLVPSGLKSSILPSLKTIENFDATWVLPEPAASNVKKLIRFEILDQPKSGKKSNKTRSPNAVKVSSHQPFADLMGLVMVTNAEKVVLDQVHLTTQGVLYEETEDEKDKLANELRNLISKVPHLQIMIDEVHHAATDDIKLRQVVNGWNKSGNINGVLGFSGTPYLSAAESVKVAEGVLLKFSQITNTVFYYPLTRAIQTFLKKPTVQRVTELQSNTIVRRGVEEFLEQYGDRVYSNGATAKLAVYCGSIERLEEQVYPLLLEMNVPPDTILKYHRGNPTHKAPEGAEGEWRILDTGLSRKRIVLLVQIGKEGWDCRSLTGVILSQKGDCPTNMVLQTSCRCLRQMDGLLPDGKPETAGIWLNADNAKTLDKQLQEEQHTSIEEINRLGKVGAPVMRDRTPRVDHLKLPPVDFFQMKVHYDTLIEEEAAPRATLRALDPASVHSHAEVITSGLNASDEVSRRFLEEERGDWADFGGWMLGISKGSFGSISLRDLYAYETEIRRIFDTITYDEGGVRRFDALYGEAALASRIRLAFCTRRTFDTRSEIVPKEAHLLVVKNLRDIAADKKNLYPDPDDCKQILELDASGKTADEYAREKNEEYEELLQFAKARNINPSLLNTPETALGAAVKNKDRSFHYVPYSFDSSFEIEFLQQTLNRPLLKERNLELYFNGEGELTEFRIDCFRLTSRGWVKVGLYTPDFLLVQRKDGKIHRALIVETKGEGFAQNFQPRRHFVESRWLEMNNQRFGYNRFDFLFLPGDMNTENSFTLEQRIKGFFLD